MKTLSLCLCSVLVAIFFSPINTNPDYKILEITTVWNFMLPSLMNASSHQPVVHLCYQEPPRTQHPESGAGRHPGAPRPCWLLCTQGVGLSGGGARWELAAQNCEEGFVKILQQPEERRSSTHKQVSMWSNCLERIKLHVHTYTFVLTCAASLINATKYLSFIYLTHMFCACPE